MPQYPTAPVVTAEISITNGEGNTSQSFVYLNSASDGESQSAEERVTCLSRSVHAADQHTADSAKCTATVSAVLHSAWFTPSVPGSSALRTQHSVPPSADLRYAPTSALSTQSFYWHGPQVPRRRARSAASMMSSSFRRTRSSCSHHSTGRMMGKEVQNEVRITELESPTRLSFIANDGKNDFLQEFTFQPMNGGTSLERRLTFEMNPIMKLMFKAVIGPLVATPSMNKSLKALKGKLEQSAS